MGLRIKKIMPQGDNYIVEGIRLALINLAIILAVSGISISLFWLVGKIRQFGFPLPLPIWAILLGTGIPCFMFWFRYGKRFGGFISERRFTKGLSLSVIGDIPPLTLLYIMININKGITDSEIYRFIFIIHMMFMIAMPIMVSLGALERQN